MRQEEKQLRERLETQDFQTNFLVEAGAGAGKSHTICQRILHQLAAGQPPETIVAITFTEKATLELKEKLDRQALDYDRRQGTRLAEQTGQIHISTIHSFCQRVLRLFPLESGCGLDFSTIEPGERRRQAEAFFDRRAGEDPDGSFARYEAFGGGRWQLKAVFLDVVADGAVPVFKSMTDPDFRRRRQELDQLLRAAHRVLHAALIPQCEGQLAVFPEDLKRAVSAPAPGPEELCTLKQSLLRAWSSSKKTSELVLEKLFFSDDHRVKELLEQYSRLRERGQDTAGQVAAIIPAVDGCLKKLEPWMPAIKARNRSLGYDLAMAAVAPAAEAFYEAARQEGGCAPDDLLRRARDLVRDVPAVRAPLMERFRVFYVDEFQDTDPIQAEFLFLLTHSGQDGERDWKRCRPVPGSLFLVGDPKQAIYRFRGADLGIYKQVLALFQSGVGQVVQLTANFRSNARICAFTDLAFDPGRNKAPTSANSLNNDPYQAGYVSMDSEQGDADGSPMVFKFRTSRNGDASFIAGLIHMAVSKGYRLRDRSGTLVPLRYGDFLILTRTRAAGAHYLKALSVSGIPVDFAGEQSLQELSLVGQIEAWLRWLLEPGSELALTEVLIRCFGLKELSLLRQVKETYTRPLSSLVFRREDRDVLADPVLVPLREALEEMERVLEARRTMPPQAFLDWLLEEQPGMQPPALEEKLLQRQYGCLRQLEQKVRSCPHRDFPRMARFALEQCRKSLERDLPLSPAEDCVRVMNLHKAKGLEGKVVILADGSVGRFFKTKAKGRYPVYVRAQDGKGSFLLYQPEEWEDILAEERKHYDAEQVRLNYVAVTRAEQLLLIACHLNKNKSESSSWSALVAKLAPLDPKKPKEEDTVEKTVKAVFQTAAASAQTAASTAAASVPDLVDRRETIVEALSAVTCRHVSPSTLDRSHHRPAAADPAEDVPQPLPEAEEAEVPPSAGPMGADWGTMVHRVMELYVRLRPKVEDVPPLLRQAVQEVLPSLSVSGRQRALLFGGQPVEDALSYLTGHLWESTRFWFDPGCPLRGLVEGGTCYGEYPFRLYLDNPAQPDQQLIAQCLMGGEEPAGPVSVTGILDLAVFKDGAWHIVDYKTDHIRPGESRESYRARLTERHQVQLEAYRRILTRLTGQTVASLQLCAIPLGGELVPLPMES